MPGSLPIDLPALAGDLARIEAALHESVRADDPFFAQVTDHLAAAGGKRLRPALAASAAYAGGAEVDDSVIRGAVAVELIHLGSLYHDDVMDEATVRRSVESANARYGNLTAILAGDFLMARASVVSAPLGVEVTELLGRTIGSLCEGQVLELSSAFDPGRTQERYLLSISGKTASLMASSCRIGALAAGLDRASIDALTAYGDELGMVFQIVDDILDLTATDAQLGKPAGNDLVEGVYTLPVLYTLEDAEFGDELRSLLVRGIERAHVDRARKLVKSSGAIDRAIAVGRDRADAARQALGAMPETHAVEVLRDLGHRLLDRLPA